MDWYGCQAIQRPIGVYWGYQPLILTSRDILVSIQSMKSWSNKKVQVFLRFIGNAFRKKNTPKTSTRWAPTSHRWGYYEWPYKWITGVGTHLVIISKLYPTFFLNSKKQKNTAPKTNYKMFAPEKWRVIRETLAFPILGGQFRPSLPSWMGDDMGWRGWIWSVHITVVLYDFKTQ